MRKTAIETDVNFKEEFHCFSDEERQFDNLISIGFEHKCVNCNLIKQNSAIYKYSGEPILNFLNTIENNIHCNFGRVIEMNCSCGQTTEMEFLKFAFIEFVIR